MDYLPLVRSLAAALGGAEAFLRSALCLEVFAERGLLRIARTGDRAHLQLTCQGKRVDLEQSVYLRQLHRILEIPSRGGELV